MRACTRGRCLAGWVVYLTLAALVVAMFGGA